MFGEHFYEQIQMKRSYFLIVSIIAIVFITGITFTFVIPGLKGFGWTFFFIALVFYFVIANIFVGLYEDRLLFVFFVSLVFSVLGMGWRLWLEWGEYSLVEHMNPVVIIGYPCIIALIISLMYQFSAKFK